MKQEDDKGEPQVTKTMKRGTMKPIVVTHDSRHNFAASRRPSSLEIGSHLCLCCGCQS